MHIALDIHSKVNPVKMSHQQILASWWKVRTDYDNVVGCPDSLTLKQDVYVRFVCFSVFSHIQPD